MRRAELRRERATLGEDTHYDHPAATDPAPIALNVYCLYRLLHRIDSIVAWS